MRLTFLLTFIILFFFTNCVEKNITNPNEAYMHWVNTDADSNIEVINGQYWQSAHWTYEYIIFLELKVDEGWWSEFSYKKDLIIDSEESCSSLDKNQPKWFNPTEYFLKYKPNSNFDQGSRYFYNPNNQTLFIYEIQL